MQEIELKQLDFTKTLSEAKTLAEQHISELEVELENCHSDMELERCLANAAREELQRSLKWQNEENAELEQQLKQVRSLRVD